MLTPEAAAAVAARKQQTVERMTGVRPLYDRAAIISDLQLIDVGFTVYEKQDPLADYDARGGLVIQVGMTGKHDFDLETGEIIAEKSERMFRTFFWHWHPSTTQAWAIIPETAVNLEACEPPQLGRVRAAMRILCKAAGERRGVAGTDELGWVSDAARLAAIVGSRWA